MSLWVDIIYLENFGWSLISCWDQLFHNYMPFGQTFEQLALLYRYYKCIDFVSGSNDWIYMHAVGILYIFQLFEIFT